MRIFIFLVFFLSLTILSAQDTIRVMHYNLLYYGNSAFCSETTNNTDQKDAYMRTILTYTKPDIITVNEMSYQSNFQQRMLNEVMNQAGYALFGIAQAPNIAQASIVNQLYYNTEKLALHSQAVAQSNVRDIDIYRLYSLNAGLEEGDTIFLNCVVAHLKSSQGQTNEDMRALMVENSLNYLEANASSGNYLFMGDFNFYLASEEGFQLMINNNDPVFRFYDPVNTIGEWHNNSSYRQVHTQSTRTAQSGNCGASGGMDDRFDFIMMNTAIHDETDRIEYIDESYLALGQDGQRFNGSISDPPNTSLPAYIIDALQGMSDHLPVVMDLLVGKDMGVNDIRYSTFDIRYSNPVKNELRLYFESPYSRIPIFTYSLFSSTGTTVLSEQLTAAGGSSVSIDVSNVPPGFYVIHISSPEGYFSGKLVVIK